MATVLIFQSHLDSTVPKEDFRLLADEVENLSITARLVSGPALKSFVPVWAGDPSALQVRPKIACHATPGTTYSDLPGITLSSQPQGDCEVIFDYGRAEGGLPSFEISRVESKAPFVRFEVVYSESREGIEHEEGDGPYFLFSNAMNTYRRESYTVQLSETPMTVTARFAQQSQRYQKIILRTPQSSIHFSSAELKPLRELKTPKSYFRTSDICLNKIYDTGVRTVEQCTLEVGEIPEAWQVTKEGTIVYGQHWAPCRHGTRWKDIKMSFDMKVNARGASWGIHMVANGVIVLLNAETRTVEVFEGLSHLDSVFPTFKKATWTLPPQLQLSDWLSIETIAVGSSVSLTIDGYLIGELDPVNIHPLLGGSENNSGSVAFGGPNGFEATYRDLNVTDLAGHTLYSNTLLAADRKKTFADFAVGSNSFACTIDGAKRDRAIFAGDLYVMGRAIYHSTGNMDAVLGSLELLTSHQTEDGYLGNLCPVQAPVHDSSEDPPTYAFYSLSYALLLITVIKDYWLQSGDTQFVLRVWPKLEKLLEFTRRFLDQRGLIVAPPPLSMDWFPLGGPIFGASSKINLAYLESLNSMTEMQSSISTLMDCYQDYNIDAKSLCSSIKTHLWNPEANLMLMGDKTPLTAYTVDVQSYAVSLSISTPSSLAPFAPSDKLPLAFRNNPRWDAQEVVSPYATGFLVEAYFESGDYESAINLMKCVWGIMADPSPQNSNYSGGYWEAMNDKGEPWGHDTSLVHGWSTWPTFLLPRYVGGLRVLESGWKRWRCKPVLVSGMTDVEVGLATPNGLVEVKVDLCLESRTGSMEVQVPLGTTAEVFAPLGWEFSSEVIRANSAFGESGIMILQGKQAKFSFSITPQVAEAE